MQCIDYIKITRTQKTKMNNETLSSVTVEHFLIASIY